MGANRKRQNKNIQGDDRFGYRPSPDKRRNPDGILTYHIGSEDRRQQLDRIRFDQFKRQWKAENESKDRHNWHNFGNPDLPVMNHKNDIMKMLATNRVSLLAGETGSGKSTQLAQYALEMGYDHIVYLQPRRVTTDGISERVKEELETQFLDKGIPMPPHLVGMAHSDHATLHEESVIQVMTSAVFKKRAPELEKNWKDKKILIVADEVHEGNIETEFAVATAAEMMTEQEKWNMVLMSATLNEEEIQDAYAPINGKSIPRVMVEGRPHAITYNESPDQTVVEVFEEHCRETSKTLIFTDGKRSIGAIRNGLLKQNPNLRILPLHSKISESDRRAIFTADDTEGLQTAIISTSAGQSGITIPGVQRVISDGWTKSPELDAENASGLPRRRCSKAEITQQMGRGGRDIDGAEFFLAQPIPLVERRWQADSENDEFVRYEDRQEHIPADIYHTVITRNVLSAASMDRDFYNLNEYLIHKVTKDTIEEAYTVLKLMGAIDDTNTITDIGREMDRYPLRPELGRAMAEVMLHGSKVRKLQLAAIAASIEVGGLASYDPGKREVIENRLSSETKDDFIAQLDYFMASAKYLGVDPDSSLLKKAKNEPDFMAEWVDISEENSDDQSLIKAGFDVKNVVRAHKQYRKICRTMGIDDEDIYTELDNTFTDSDRLEIHKLLLTGMPHLLYHEVGRKKWRGRKKKDQDGLKHTPPPQVWYRNMIGPDVGTSYEFDRRISNRSVLAKLAIGKTELIAGYPRWYIDDDDDMHNVIEKGFKTTKAHVRDALGKTALTVKSEVLVSRDGHLKLVSTSSIGQLRTGKDSKRAKADTSQRIDLLVMSALEKPGAAQRELRKLKVEMHEIAERIPQKLINYYFDKPPLSQLDLESMVAKAATNASSTGELDANLRENLRQEGITMSYFIHPDKLQSIEDNMPDTLDIAGNAYDLHYEGDEALPYINDFPLTHTAWLPDRLTIRDGREVRFRYRYDAGDYRYLSASEVKEMGA
jgi:HrpA-like RNA helicase